MSKNIISRVGSCGSERKYADLRKQTGVGWWDRARKRHGRLRGRVLVEGSSLDMTSKRGVSWGRGEELDLSARVAGNPLLNS